MVHLLLHQAGLFLNELPGVCNWAWVATLTSFLSSMALISKSVKSFSWEGKVPDPLEPRGNLTQLRIEHGDALKHSRGGLLADEPSRGALGDQDLRLGELAFGDQCPDAGTC